MAETTSGTFNFELVSPERRLMAGPAHMVVVPGTEGDFGVLANHSALVSSLRAGVLSVHQDGQAEPLRIFVAGGFADVSPTNLTVLAEDAVRVDDLDAAALEQTLRNLGDDMTTANGEAEKARIANRIAITRTKLAVATGQAA